MMKVAKRLVSGWKNNNVIILKLATYNKNGTKLVEQRQKETYLLSLKDFT